MRSSRSVQLVFLGSALALIGCGGDQQAAKKPCPLRPDGTPDPNCSGGNRSYVRTGGAVYSSGYRGGSGSTTSGVASSTSGGVRTGGFGGTGGSVSASS